MTEQPIHYYVYTQSPSFCSPGGGNGNPLQYSYLGNPRDRSLVAYSPQGCKELDMTEHSHTSCYICLGWAKDLKVVEERL